MKKRRFRKSALRLLWVLVLLVALVRPNVLTAVAGPADSLTIRVGYFGGPYYEKEIMSVSELEALGAYWQTFTFLDAGGFPAYATAYGVALTDILAAAGVDIGSVGTCHFKTSDSASYHTSVTADTLYGSQRYAFPALAEYYGAPAGEIESRITDYNAVWQSAVPVQTVLSLQDNYARVDEFTPYDASAYTLRSDKRLRLFFGQTQPDEINARHMAYWVYGIDVEFAGSPVLQMQDTELKLSIGEDYQAQLTVSAADPVIAEAIRGGLRWESSEPSVVSVDGGGRLTVLRKGEAVVTAYFDDYELSASLHIVVGDEESLGGDGEGSGSGDGSGDGSGEGEGSGSGSTDLSGEGSGGREDAGTLPEDNGAEAVRENDAPSDTAQAPTEQENSSRSGQGADGGPAASITDVETNISVALRGRRITVARSGSPQGMEADDSSGGGGGAPIELVLVSSPLRFYLLLGAFLLLAGGGILMWRKYKKEI